MIRILFSRPCLLVLHVIKVGSDVEHQLANSLLLRLLLQPPRLGKQKSEDQLQSHNIQSSPYFRFQSPSLLLLQLSVHLATNFQQRLLFDATRSQNSTFRQIHSANFVPFGTLWFKTILCLFNVNICIFVLILSTNDFLVKNIGRKSPKSMTKIVINTNAPPAPSASSQGSSPPQASTTALSASSPRNDNL